MQSLSLKRLFDFIGAAALLILAAPLMLVTGLLVWSTMGRPVFFRQARAGR
ncbi:MAG: sugar transferase, partial [Planctomycetota bacterium]